MGIKLDKLVVKFGGFTAINNFTLEITKGKLISLNTAKFAVATGYLPVRKSAEDTQIMKDSLNDPNALFTKIYPIAQSSLEYAYYTTAVNNVQSVREIIKEKYDAYVTGNIKDIDTFIKDTTSQVEISIQRQ